jgi:hypothetical protein
MASDHLLDAERYWIQQELHTRSETTMNFLGLAKMEDVMSKIDMVQLRIDCLWSDLNTRVSNLERLVQQLEERKCKCHSIPGKTSRQKKK